MLCRDAHSCYVVDAASIFQNQLDMEQDPKACRNEQRERERHDHANAPFSIGHLSDRPAVPGMLILNILEGSCYKANCQIIATDEIEG